MAHPEPIEAPKPPPQENVVLPGLRADLLVSQQMFEGRSYYVVKDPISLQYFRMTAEDYFLATLFDGRRTFGAIREIYGERFPHVRLDYTPEELNERVLRFANDLALLQFLSVQGQRMKARWEAAKVAKKKKSGLYNLANQLFFFRKSVFDPDLFFGYLEKRFSWIYTRTVLWVSTVLIVLGAIVFFQHTDRIGGAIANLFSLQNVALMWVTMFIIKSIHELGHGVTCKHFGGEVHEVGVMMLVFQPYFFVNVSDSWTMPNRMHRVLVSFAGIYVELIFAAVATFFWAVVQPGALRDFLFNFIFLASVSTIIFNANPLMRFDGYYIMMDLLEVPNLQTKSRALITHHIKRLLFGVQGADPALQRMPLPKKRFWLFYTYAILSWLYGYWIIISLVVFMKPHLEPLGLGGLADWFSVLALTSWVVVPFIGFFKSLNLKRDDWNPGGRLRRLGNIVAVALGIFAVMCFVPWNLSIKRAGTVELAEPGQVRPEVTGFVQQVLVKEGERVKPGMTLARLMNRDAQQVRTDADTRLKIAEATVQRALGEGKPAEFKQAESMRAAAETRFKEADRDVRNLTLVSHVEGAVLTRGLDQLKGRLIKSGEIFCEIAPLDPLRIKIALSEKQVRYIDKDQRVVLKAHAFPDREFHGVIAEKPVMFFGTAIPRGFSKKYGGDVLTYTDHEGREIPVERTFEAVVVVENKEGLLRPGMTVRGKVHAGRHPWGKLVLQSLLDLLSLDYRFIFS
ncbi:MAG: efflux RND transporter periplasmic adaptor subunit [Chthoniobacteraceae bacterium]